MAKAPYEPPKQSISGQTIDSLFLLALVFAALFAPLYLGLAGGGKTSVEFKDQTWVGWNQNATMQAQWEKLGYTEGAKIIEQKPDGTEEVTGNATSAGDLIAARFDYTFDPMWLAITALVVIAYFYIVIVFHWSAKEYRDVIDEKFNNK